MTYRCGSSLGLPEVSTMVGQSAGGMEQPWPKKVQTLFIDDIDGSAAEGTVRFGLDGTDYEIDLNAEHAQQLRDALAAYVRAGRRVGGGSRQAARDGRRGSASGPKSTEVREWARTQGIDVKDRGRVPAELVVKFKTATGQ